MKDDSLLAHAGRHPFKNKGVVNPPVYHASTILFPTLDSFHGRDPKVKVTYGRKGTPTSHALEDAVCALEGGAGTVTASSGLGAVTTAIQACTKAGDHVLITDSVYAPTRLYMDKMLARFGVTVEYYEPTIGADIEKYIKPETAMIFMEAPGSWTFEMQDVPAIVSVAKKHEILTIIDNTWSAGYFFKPLSLGVDISVQAATKYIVGHSDAMMGVITCNEATLPRVREAAWLLGMCAGPDDLYLAQRGLRSMGTRLRQHHENGVKLANWLKNRPEVTRVMHPALPDDPGHEIWKRDFTGACGLFGFVMNEVPEKALAAMLEGLHFFGMGYSWGGFESLLIPVNPNSVRTAAKWDGEGQTMRMHVGLEDVEDLILDLEAGFERLKQAL
ncbi:cystathionine beta-lyase [Aestuariispira insulae]|uniref:Cystathionine beta-lyase n=1 Tax=Aestuariispira insulae TaxID=1461337 RepID=A0A3D9HNB6_9PROT|nr:cystathionine beta-lyase [Aestuariispira insulae]RED50992.1 cystathionine beta-lyase [Aestuariispira insulae]